MHKSSFKMNFIAFFISFGSFFMGYMQSYFNEANQTMKIILNISSNLLDGVINSAMPIGAVIGAGFSTFLM